MAQIKIRPDLFAAFNFNMDSKKPIGHLTKLTLGTKELTPNLELQSPENFQNGNSGIAVTVAQKSVGAITAIRWDGGYADPITLTCQVNAANKQEMAMLIHAGLNNTACKFQFCVYEYDYDNSTPAYYKSFFCEAELNGLVEKNHGTLEIEINPEPSEVVTSPRNFELYLSILPQDAATQTIKYAVSKDAEIVKGWGVKAAAV